MDSQAEKPPIETAQEIILALDTAINNETNAEAGGNNTVVRVLGPAYTKLLNTLPDYAQNRRQMLANKLRLWAMEARREAEERTQGRYIPPHEFDHYFGKSVEEYVYPLLLGEYERKALEEASKVEGRRILERTNNEGLAWEVNTSPVRLLKELLLVVDGVLQNKV